MPKWEPLTSLWKPFAYLGRQTSDQIWAEILALEKGLRVARDMGLRGFGIGHSVVEEASHWHGSILHPD